MRKGMLIAATGLIAATAACATTEPGGPTDLGGNAQCNADDAQSFIGQKATAQAGEELLRGTKARQLRWVPPRTAVTMDFRADRLTVSYDDDMVIERISCG